eukprot:3867616-Rhodomonas_salina.3
MTAHLLVPSEQTGPETGHSIVLILKTLGYRNGFCSSSRARSNLESASSLDEKSNSTRTKPCSQSLARPLFTHLNPHGDLRNRAQLK